MIPCNPSIYVKTETVPTVVDIGLGVRHTYIVIYKTTIGYVIPGPVLGYQLFQTIAVTRHNYDYRILRTTRRFVL